MKKITLLSLIVFAVVFFSCAKEEPPLELEKTNDKVEMIKERIKAYDPTEITVDMSHLTDNQKMLVKKLVEAGMLADKIFWQQSNHDAIPTRDSLIHEEGEEAEVMLKYVNINYGPYDVIYDQKRFVGSGPDIRPLQGGFYPVDLTKAEFEAYIEANPEVEEELRGQYSIVERYEETLIATPYHKFYPEQIQMADKLDEAAEYADNPSLKKYLKLRAEALRTDNYYESDLAWMEIKDNDIDLVLGPIENYEDELYGYRSAHEAVVMVKDPEATAELEMYKKNIVNFQKMLPLEEKYINMDIGEGNIIQVVNVVYFGGDCQKAIKTIAAALPNDPKVAEAKGRKLSMYKNHMEAKFESIVDPIGDVLLKEEIAKYVDKKAFTNFVTLHEVSHALGPKYVRNEGKVEITDALKDTYSAIEECKADILSMYNHKHLLDMGIYDAEYIEKAKATYLAGLYRSIRFGTGAHAKANYIQLNFLREKGAIIKDENGKFTINDEIFFDKVAELAEMILMTQYEGDYDKASEILDTYAVFTDEIKSEIEALKDIPRDIDTKYTIVDALDN
jgi:hypothetical protein